MILLILDTIALASASVGAFAGVRAISNIDAEKEKFKKISSLYDETFRELEGDLIFTKNLIEQYNQLRQDTISNTEKIFIFFDKNIDKIKNLHPSELSIQQIQECKNTFNEIKQSLIIDTNPVDSLKSSYYLTNLTNPVKLAVEEIISHNLSVKQTNNSTRNCLSKSSMRIIAGSTIILSLLASANIAVSPAVLITGFILTRLQEEALIQVREYESEVNTGIDKINLTKDLMLKIRQQISESMKKLKFLNDAMNEFLATDNIAGFTHEATQVASKLAYCAPVAHELKIFIPLVKSLVEMFIPKILDYEGKLKNVALGIKDNHDDRRFLLGLDEVINIKLERELLNSII
ncbi:MAG: hypothetical protein RM347_016350 [Nostoc sp. ChiQUE02]|uniref:hypothetical protein n=1 Tax=Nostoc sp. ChiQUE02 TaxID=3075377 RepID=UPI002AD242A2|nr:hypothetical protein [Nostoc sp. ChiQUE02]MDZ8228957.1 hypothetical protein [Nostoc sp. ChiQUE02]